MIRILFCIVLLLSPTLGLADISFDRDVRPILSDNCYACHGPDEESREGGDPDTGGFRLDTHAGAMIDLGGYTAIVPGKPDESELIRRILSTEEGEMMPPAEHRKRLTADQKRTLVEWVKQGAEWSDQWAWTAPKRFEPPAVEHKDRVGNWIDQFVLARLEKVNLEPSGQADRRTLIRRLSFDLLGLPPKPEDVKSFVSDTRDDAWERLVDRMLESPHYGERMAVYWLDLVRYADTVGYHGDQPVSMSPYRDYVIDAFNNNMPFDRFTKEQLGGDLLPEPTREQLIASGYNKLGMMSAEGGAQPKEYLAKYASDRVRTASTVWMGSTVGCAECHDHKFDPFTTKDFYRFAAFFADIKERGLYAGAFADGSWGPSVEIQEEQLPALLKPIDERLAVLQKTADTSTAELEAAQAEWEKTMLAEQTDWQPLAPSSVTAVAATEFTVLDDQSVLASGPLGEVNTYRVTVNDVPENITGLRIELLPHDSLPDKGPGRADGGSFVLTEFTVTADDQPVALQNAQADFEQAPGLGNPYGKWTAASVIDKDVKGKTWGWAVSPQLGRTHDLIVETTTPVTAKSLAIQLDQNLDIAPNFNIGRFRLWASTAKQPLGIDRVMRLADGLRQNLKTPAAERTDEQKQQLAAHYRSIAPSLKPVRDELAQLQRKHKQIKSDHTRTSLITVSVEPREMRVLPRGNWMDESGEVVQPGVPAFLPQIEKDDRANRLDLAEWLMSDGNPITARVFVNRLWKLCFGTGISKVLDDVGSQGEPPTHPQLLDTLAMEFTASGWDLKHMMRLIVTSNTYRQSSLMRKELRDVDPYNRLLARQSRFRLDAEFVRDNALATSGLLVSRIGGRSAKPYQPAGLYRHLNFPMRTYEQDNDENQYRRGVYTHWQRQFLHPAMKSFDAPAREECTAERPRSNTPLAALVMLNDPSYVEAARVLAERCLKLGGTTDAERIGWIVDQSLSRNVRDEERDVLLSLLTSQREVYSADPKSAKQFIATGLRPVEQSLDQAELAAWTSVTRAVFNMHEFITRN